MPSVDVIVDFSGVQGHDIRSLQDIVETAIASEDIDIKFTSASINPDTENSLEDEEDEDVPTGDVSVTVSIDTEYIFNKFASRFFSKEIKEEITNIIKNKTQSQIFSSLEESDIREYMENFLEERTKLLGETAEYEICDISFKS